MEYNFNAIEQKWQTAWKNNEVYKVSNSSPKPKYYVLDMFPYPSGSGLHVGHPLGYIASDIYSRYKRLKGFNVLHPMGFDSFGLPAEQYALETGQHPATTTQKNIATFKQQLDKIGFCYDWSREIQTSEPSYYKWTQKIFLDLFNSWYNPTSNKAESITTLINQFETIGSNNFTATEWLQYTETEKADILMQYRLAYSKYGEVNWCEALGTVLANDEVVNGVSERGGHPVVKKKMKQWYLRITAYAERLLQGLETVDFSDSMKEMQRNWIGRSEGAELTFNIKHSTFNITVYTTRPDTIFGVDFMVVAPELDWIADVVSDEQKEAVNNYINYVKSRSDRERQAEVKQVTGCFTGAYAINPFNGKEIPIYIAEYVLAGYGTGAIMGVPCGDERDFKFAQHFNIPITNIIGEHFNGKEANPTKDAILENSDFLNGLVMKDAIAIALNKIEALGIGKRKVNYKMRDAGFSRQRYWGEPFPIVWNNGVAVALEETDLPLELPHVDKYGPGPEGEGPLANIDSWISPPSFGGSRREASTMPGYAGSSWYFLRYMDPHNAEAFVSKQAADYWNSVDLYVGGTEHAVGHLLYSRMWTKVLFDLGYINFEEPFKKLLNQGMITGISEFLYKIKPLDGDEIVNSHFIDIIINGTNQRNYINGLDSLNTVPIYFSSDIALEFNQFKQKELGNPSFERYILANRINIECTDKNIVDYKLLLNMYPHYFDCVFATKTGYYFKGDFIYYDNENPTISQIISTSQSEKMSKSKLNTQNPNELCDKYGADTFRMYEMFLGPVEQSKPWDTKGIEGVHRFLKKLWRLFYHETKGFIVTNDAPTAAELKILHKTIQKIESDTERFSYNTAVSTFMVCVNELTEINCHKKEILEPLLILMAPYAPHITEELYNQLTGGYLWKNETSTVGGGLEGASYPTFNPAYVVESSKEYPISINGKVRTNINLALDMEQPSVEAIVLENEIVQKWLEGKSPKKVIFVKGKMINVVV